MFLKAAFIWGVMKSCYGYLKEARCMKYWKKLAELKFKFI